MTPAAVVVHEEEARAPLTLTVRRIGSKWHVCWPTITPDYAYPTPAHDDLAVWWRGQYIDECGTGTRTIKQLLSSVDLAARHRPPPHAFELVRLGRVVRTYRSAADIYRDAQKTDAWPPNLTRGAGGDAVARGMRAARRQGRRS